jgi:hypothetical protein
MEKQEKEYFYVIACVFNPAGFKTRIDLYNKFEKHMLDSGVKLMTVECIYGENSEFSVTTNCNPNHIQLHAQDPLWHKENLLNIAIRRLPDYWKYLVWLDADIEFLEKDWSDRIIQSFTKYDIIQVFKYAHFLGPNEEILQTHYSMTYAIAEELPISKAHYSVFYPHPGYGWGVTRRAWDYLGGLIDWGLIGSGDCHMAFSLFGKFELSYSYDANLFHPEFLNLTREWQTKALKFYHEKRIGAADCVIKHFYHGPRADRRYVERMRLLIKHQYDPVNDLGVDNNGIYYLKESQTDLKKEILNYFLNRNEDSKSQEVSLSNDMRGPEEVLNDAIELKRVLQQEQLEKARRSLTKNRKNDMKRSKSSVNKKTKRPQVQNNSKSRLFDDLKSDKENSEISNSSTSDNESSHNSASFEINNDSSPSRSVNAGSVDSLFYRYGCQSSKPKANSNNVNKQNGKSESDAKNYESNNNSDHHKNKVGIMNPINPINKNENNHKMVVKNAQHGHKTNAYHNVNVKKEKKKHKKNKFNKSISSHDFSDHGDHNYNNNGEDFGENNGNNHDNFGGNHYDNHDDNFGGNNYCNNYYP